MTSHCMLQYRRDLSSRMSAILATSHSLPLWTQHVSVIPFCLGKWELTPLQTGVMLWTSRKEEELQSLQHWTTPEDSSKSWTSEIRQLLFVLQSWTVPLHLDCKFLSQWPSIQGHPSCCTELLTQSSQRSDCLHAVHSGNWLLTRSIDTPAKLIDLFVAELCGVRHIQPQQSSDAGNQLGATRRNQRTQSWCSKKQSLCHSLWRIHRTFLLSWSSIEFMSVQIEDVSSPSSPVVRGSILNLETYGILWSLRYGN